MIVSGLKHGVVQVTNVHFVPYRYHNSELRTSHHGQIWGKGM